MKEGLGMLLGYSAAPLAPSARFSLADGMALGSGEVRWELGSLSASSA